MQVTHNADLVKARESADEKLVLWKAGAESKEAELKSAKELMKTMQVKV